MQLNQLNWIELFELEFDWISDYMMITWLYTLYINWHWFHLMIDYSAIIDSELIRRRLDFNIQILFSILISLSLMNALELEFNGMNRCRLSEWSRIQTPTILMIEMESIDFKMVVAVLMLWLLFTLFPWSKSIVKSSWSWGQKIPTPMSTITRIIARITAKVRASWSW